MSYQLRTITPPATEPLTLAEAKLHLRVDDSTDDALISSLISSCRVEVETALKRAILTSTFKLTMDRTPETGVVILPRAPLQSITDVKYYTGGVLTTLDPTKYIAVAGDPGYLHPVASQSWSPLIAWPSLGLYWPATDVRADAIQIQFVAGLADTIDTVDPGTAAVVKTAMKLLLAHRYENREAVVFGQISNELPLGVDAVLDCLRTGVYR